MGTGGKDVARNDDTHYTNFHGSNINPSRPRTKTPGNVDVVPERLACRAFRHSTPSSLPRCHGRAGGGRGAGVDRH